MAEYETKRERTKLTATYWNGLSIVLTGAGVVVLPITLISQPQNVWVYDFAGPMLIVGGILLHLLARWHLRALETLPK